MPPKRTGNERITAGSNPATRGAVEGRGAFVDPTLADPSLLEPADDGVTRIKGGALPGVEAVSFAGAEAAGSTVGYDTTGLLPQLDPASFDSVMGTTTSTKSSGGGAGVTFGSASGGVSAVVDFAQSLIGTPYVWGGTSTRGVDCSGLTYLAYKAAGITLPRVSFQQASVGSRVSYKNARPGDLVFWDNSSRNNGADHVAIYVGNGYIIEAARPGTNVRRRRLGADEGAWITRPSAKDQQA